MDETLPKQAILVVNAMSRKGADAFEEVRAKLEMSGVELIEAHAVTEPEKMDGVVIDAIARAPMVILGGGDGSLSSNVDHFVGQDTVFAVLPLGTANSFARTLGLPLDLDGAIDVIANGRRKTIDLGIIDGDYFANAAALGLSPLIADTVPHKLKKYLGMVGYLIWAARVAFKFRPFRLRVTLDDGTLVKSWATEARIFNGTHHGGVELTENPDARQRRHRHPGGHRQKPVGPGVELVRDPVQDPPARADDHRVARQEAAAGSAAEPEDQHRRRNCCADAGYR